MLCCVCLLCVCVPLCVSVFYYSISTNPASGEVFTWGLNDHGQCGVPAPPQSAPPPLKGVQNRPDGHTDVRSSTEGRGDEDEVAGRIEVKHVWLPQRLEGIEPIAQVHSGWSHVVIVTSE